MNKLLVFLCAAAVALGMTSCVAKETKSVFDGYSVYMSRDEVVSKLGEPDDSFVPSGVGGFDFCDMYEANVPYFGMNGYFSCYYCNEDDPVLTSMEWRMNDDIISVDEKKSEIDGIITLYDKLYGIHTIDVSSDEVSLSERTVYEWEDESDNSVYLWLETYVDGAVIKLEITDNWRTWVDERNDEDTEQ